MTLETITSIGGWIGMAMLLYAYAARKNISPARYALLNLIGAGLVGVNCLVTKAWPAVALETAWMAIALRELIVAKQGISPNAPGPEKR